MADNAISPRIPSIGDLICRRNHLADERKALFQRQEAGEYVTCELEWNADQCDELDSLIDHMSVGMSYTEAIDCFLIDHEPVDLSAVAA
jgi:hypothetical protein